MLERIVYISAAREPQTEESVGRILDVSRSRNAANHITGLLIGGGAWWMQLIEGETDKLEPIWQSIRADPRHDPVVMVQRRAVRQRSFTGWSLQFRDTDDESFGTLLEELTGSIADPRLRNQVRRFADTFLKPGADFPDFGAD
jgi:hypothetical protein